MMNRACAVSILVAASLISAAGAATANPTSPKALVSAASNAAEQAQWDAFLECFTPAARKQLMVSLAKPIFSVASANNDLESELERRLNSLGVSKSMILSGKDLSRQARFIELLVDFAKQNNIRVASYWTNPGSFTLNGDNSVANLGSSQQNGVPTSFVLTSHNGSFLFDLPVEQNAKSPMTPSNAQANASQSGPWIAKGLFPEYRTALSAMKHASFYTPNADWFAGVPSVQPDLNPGQIVVAAFPGQSGSTLHVCMLMGLKNGQAQLLTSDGSFIAGVPGAMIAQIDNLADHIGRDAQAGDTVLAFAKDGSSYFGRVTGFENGAPVVSYYNAAQGSTQTGAMGAALPVNQSQCVMYQMLAFECDGAIDTALCVAQTPGVVWLATPGGLEARSADEVQLLAWSGTDTADGVEQFSAQNSVALASADFLPAGAQLQLEITSALTPFPAYAVGGVDTDNDN